MFESTVRKVYEIQYANLPSEVKTWIVEHPDQTIFRINNGVVFIHPHLFPDLRCEICAGRQTVRELVINFCTPRIRP